MLELGILPKDVQMEEVGKWLMWGPAVEPVSEGPPLVPLTEALYEESSIALAQEDGAMADNDAMA